MRELYRPIEWVQSVETDIGVRHKRKPPLVSEYGEWREYKKDGHSSYSDSGGHHARGVFHKQIERDNRRKEPKTTKSGR